MIRLAALACGLLCGMGLIVSGLFYPSMVGAFSEPMETWDAGLGIGLLTILLVAGALVIATRWLPLPLLGDDLEKPAEMKMWKPLLGGLLFGIGWALSGYFPAAAVVSLGMFAPGAAIFLISVLGGIVLHDLIATKGRLRSGE